MATAPGDDRAGFLPGSYPAREYCHIHVLWRCFLCHEKVPSRVTDEVSVPPTEIPEWQRFLVFRERLLCSCSNSILGANHLSKYFAILARKDLGK